MEIRMEIGKVEVGMKGGVVIKNSGNGSGSEN